MVNYEAEYCENKYHKSAIEERAFQMQPPKSYSTTKFFFSSIGIKLGSRMLRLVVQ